jgi:hypothetical protein
MDGGYSGDTNINLAWVLIFLGNMLFVRRASLFEHWFMNPILHTLNSYQLMQDCWKETKEERPTFTQLRLQLKAQTIGLNRKSSQPGKQSGGEYNI